MTLVVGRRHVCEQGLRDTGESVRCAARRAQRDQLVGGADLSVAAKSAPVLVQVLRTQAERVLDIAWRRALGKDVSAKEP